MVYILAMNSKRDHIIKKTPITNVHTLIPIYFLKLSTIQKIKIKSNYVNWQFHKLM